MKHYYEILANKTYYPHWLMFY